MAKEAKNDPRFILSDPPCAYCAHLISMGSGASGDYKGWQCKAFPNKIPVSILTKRKKHTKKLRSEPQEGDFVFESKQYTIKGKQYAHNWDGEWIEV